TRMKKFPLERRSTATSTIRNKHRRNLRAWTAVSLPLEWEQGKPLQVFHSIATSIALAATTPVEEITLCVHARMHYSLAYPPACLPAGPANGVEITMSRIDELDIVIRHKGGKVIAGIPQLSLYTKADEVHAAITALEQKRTAFFGDLAESGALDDLEVRHYGVERAPPRQPAGLGQFTLKAVIVIGLIAGAFALSSLLLATRIERLVANADAQMKQYTGAPFWAKVERELERAADPARDMPPEQKRKLLAQIHTAVERWRPFAAEI